MGFEVYGDVYEEWGNESKTLMSSRSRSWNLQVKMRSNRLRLRI